jgi:hypothetical protein
MVSNRRDSWVSKAQDESELRRIEPDTVKLEQQNDSSVTNSLADDWVYRGVKVLTKSDFQTNVKEVAESLFL